MKHTIQIIFLKFLSTLIIVLFITVLFTSCSGLDKPTSPNDTGSSEIKIISCTEFTQYGITFYFTHNQLKGTGIRTFSFDNKGKTYTYMVAWVDGCLRNVEPQ